MTAEQSILIPQEFPCAFCAYIRGERPYTFLWKDADSSVMVTREQRGIPHLLVVPNRHVATILDVTAQEASQLAIAVRRSARAIERAYRSVGIAVWQNNGMAAGQAIAHVHFHVAGTLPGGGTEWGNVSELALPDTDKIAERLRPFFTEESAA
ncbi:HIT family protein [Cupriavidus plantarum]|uniref:HIT family protein n=1 Tax=Cupriavidus plantarum TaxID=942865 RepID=UPI000E285DE1|nr:HIT family protein [Cupriavidus plantarum]REF03033.1 histidine triad (HIT) family protein [Cupriavidus plantarum]RLK44101.1 histidine triad (HIT) family protein [Cupriavidus plantarum]